MTDRLDGQKLRTTIKTSSALTPSAIIYTCLDDSFQNNIKYLEDNNCNAGLLKNSLKSQLEEGEENASMMGNSPYNPLISPDMEVLLKYLEEYAQQNAGTLPTFEEILTYVSEEHTKNSDNFAEVMFALKSSGYNPIVVRENNKYKTINKHCTDLVVKAKNNRLDPMIGRESEVERMIEILAHYKKKNPLLVGEAGVGKTAVVEGLASAIAQGKVPDVLKRAKIFSTSVARLVAGTKFRGDMEEKISSLIDELKKHEQDTGLPTYLFIDEIHQIIGAGSGSNNDGSNIANIIKPELASGEIALIGATTQKEYKRTIQKDTALDRRFQIVRINEPSDEETIEIIKKGIAPVLTNFHGVKFPKSVIESTVKLSSKYITDKAQPDKSISILDSIGARLRTTESRINAKVSDVERLISTITGAPVSAFKEVTKDKAYVDIEKELNGLVFGQSEAVKKIAEIYERSKAGLSEEGQPIGSVLAVGPTGVGKTEVAKTLAEVTQSNFFKINMGEYTEQHSVAKLFGAPPGYVAHAEGGILTNEIRKNPHTIILLDEIEKAHTKVFEALLGIIDGASMRDGEGNPVDFSNTFIIMTSNVGAADSAARKVIDLSGKSNLLEKAKSSVSMRALQAVFSPEFRNKLTAVINFNSLGSEEIRKVTEKFLGLAKDKLMERKGVELKFTESVYDYISGEGFDPQFGARPCKKLIDSEIVDVLVKPLLKGEVKRGDKVEFDVQNGSIVYEVNQEEKVLVE